MNVKIRQEHNDDLPIIIDLIESAFRNVRESDHKEQLLVERLHESEKFIPPTVIGGGKPMVGES